MLDDIREAFLARDYEINFLTIYMRILGIMPIVDECLRGWIKCIDAAAVRDDPQGPATIFEDTPDKIIS